MARGEGNRPWYPWYPGDLKRDTAVQTCPLVVRGLWREMLDLMHDGEPYGHLTAGGIPITISQLARMVGASPARVKIWIGVLEDRKVFSRTPDGIIYSRRMVRDEAQRRRAAQDGEASTRGRQARPRTGKVGRLFNFLMQRFSHCLNCPATLDLEIHRIVPGRHGGPYAPGNVLLLCKGCHDLLEDGELGVADILSRNGVSTAADLFLGFGQGLEFIPFAIPTPIPSNISSRIPPQRQRQRAEIEEKNGAAGAAPSQVAICGNVENSDADDGEPYTAPPGPTPTKANVRLLAALIRSERLSLEPTNGETEADLVEAIKAAAARRQLPYDGRTVAKALESVRFTQRHGLTRAARGP